MQNQTIYIFKHVEQMKAMKNMEYGLITIVLAIIFALIGIWFGIVTTIAIVNVLGVTGLTWWICAITIFGALGGIGGSIINIGWRE